ncbi:hypothetical protein QE152_g30693 [Popillia japonica]|uniref:Nuclease HARBI1 n=1 Tax=Popillia japonica TaxID=7064 RepID=A0AAW1JE15_POPJA
MEEFDDLLEEIDDFNNVSATLKFYGCNSFQVIIGDLRGISQATISRIKKNVSTAIARRCANHVKFPVDIADQRRNIAMFREMANFPTVCGCIDCTHIAVNNPGVLHAEVFRNRKEWFSLNML